MARGTGDDDALRVAATRCAYPTREARRAQRSRAAPGRRRRGRSAAEATGSSVLGDRINSIGSIGTDADAERFARAVRGQWSIENELHWSLDLTVREDTARVRERNAAENFTVLRHIALTRLKNDTRVKGSLKTKRLTAGWNDGYLAALLLDPHEHPVSRDANAKANIRNS